MIFVGILFSVFCYGSVHSTFYPMPLMQQPAFYPGPLMQQPETVDVIQIRLSVYSGKRDKVFNIYRYNPYFQPILRALKKRALKGSNPVSGYNGFEVTLYKRGSYEMYFPPPPQSPPPRPYHLYNDIQELLPFDCLRFNELLPTEPLLGECCDVYGNFVPYGGMYFDGIYWKICGKNHKVKPGYGVLERKWQTIFRMFDVTRDNVISSADEMRMVELFVKYFSMKGEQVNSVQHSIALVWKMLFINHHATKGKSLGNPLILTESMFIRQMERMYTLRRGLLHATVMKVSDLLLFVTDNNRDGYISFPEWDVLFKIFGVTDQRVTYFLFSFTEPNFWGYSSLLDARMFIKGLFLDTDPHYFFKFDSILQPSKPVMRSSKPLMKPSKLVIKSTKSVMKSPQPMVKPSKSVMKQSKPMILSPKPAMKPSKPMILSSKPPMKQFKPIVKLP